MARTNIPVQTIAKFNGKVEDISFTLADSSNNHEFVHPGGDVLFVMRNATASSHSVQFIGVASGRTFKRAQDITLTNALTSSRRFSFINIPDEGFDQGGGVVHVDTTAPSTVVLAIFKLEESV